MDIEKIVTAQSSESAESRHLIKSVMTPMIQICLICVPTSFGGAYLLRDNLFLSAVLAIVGVVVVLAACSMFVYFGITKPERLQSEDFQIRQETLQIIAKKGGRIVIEPISLIKVIQSAADRGEEKK